MLETIEVTQTTPAVAGAVPYAVDIIGSDAFQDRHPRTIPDALRGLPSVQVQKTANGHGSPYIRGFTGNRTLALIDGVRYNNSTYRDGGNEYFAHIDIHTIEQIELLRGPASILYGSEAVGGALNLRTHTAFKLLDNNEDFDIAGLAGVRLATGEQSETGFARLSFGQRDDWAITGGVSVKSYGDIIAADLGTLPKTGYGETAYNIRGDWQLADHWQLTGVYQDFQQDDVWRTHSTIFSVPFAATSIGSDQVRQKDQTRQLSYLRFTGDGLASWIDTASVTLSHQPRRDRELRIREDGIRIDQSFQATMSGIDVITTHLIGSNTLRLGTSLYRDKVDSERVDTSADDLFQTVQIQGPVGDDATYDQAAIFVQWEKSWSRRFQTIAGARYSHVAADIGRFRDPATNTETAFSGDWDNVSLSLRGSLALDQSQTQFLWASASQAFRAPNIADLTRFGRSRSDEIETAATDLSPETFLSAELGWRLVKDRYGFDITGHYTDISDYIDTAPTGQMLEGLTEVTKQNLSEGFVHGVDLHLRYTVSDAVEVTFAASWIDGELTAPSFPPSSIDETEPLSRIAPPSARIAVKWAPEHRPWSLTGEALSVGRARKLSSGDHADTQRIPPGGTPAYTVINLSGAYALSDQIDLSLTLENLTDQAYRTHGSGSNEVGFNAILALSTKF